MSNAFDSVNYPTREPDRLVIGDRWTWKRTDLTDYPVASYALTYQVVELGSSKPQRFTITAGESGDDYVIEVGASTTADYAPGTYAWALYITRSSDSERLQLESGTWELVADLATTESDLRSHARKVLDALEDCIEGRATDGVASYSIGGRSISKMGPDELLKWRDYYRREWMREQDEARMARGLAPSGRVRVRM